MKNFIVRFTSIFLIIFYIVTLLPMDTAYAAAATGDWCTELNDLTGDHFLLYNTKELRDQVDQAYYSCKHGDPSDLTRKITTDEKNMYLYNKINSFIKTHNDHFKQTWTYMYVYKVEKQNLKDILKEKAPSAYAVLEDSTILSDTDRANKLIQNENNLKELDAAIKLAATHCLLNECNPQGKQCGGPCVAICEQLSNIRYDGTKPQRPYVQTQGGPNVLASNDNGSYFTQYHNMRDDILKYFYYRLIHDKEIYGMPDNNNVNWVLAQDCAGGGQSEKLVYQLLNRQGPIFEGIDSYEGYRAISLNTYYFIIDSIRQKMQAKIDDPNTNAQTKQDLIERLAKGAKIDSAYCNENVPYEKPSEESWGAKIWAEITRPFARSLLERLSLGAFEIQLFQDSRVVITEAQSKYYTSNEYKENTSSGVDRYLKPTINDKLIDGIQRVVKFFTSIQQIVIVLALLKIALTLMASAVNPSLRATAKDDLYKVICFALIILTMDYVFTVLIETNNVIVRQFAKFVYDVGVEQNAGMGKDIAETGIAVCIGAACSTPTIITALSTIGILELIAIIVGLIFAIIMYFKMFMRFVVICFLYAVSPLAALLLMFKTTRQAFGNIWKEAIAQIFLPAIYAGLYCVAYCVIAIGKINILDVWAFSYIGPITRVAMLAAVFHFGKKVQQLFGLAGTGFTPDTDRGVANTLKGVATTAAAVGFGVATGGAATGAIAAAGAAGNAGAGGSAAATASSAAGSFHEKYQEASSSSTRTASFQGPTRGNSTRMPDAAPEGELSEPEQTLDLDSAERTRRLPGYFGKLGKYLMSGVTAENLAGLLLKASFAPFQGLDNSAQEDFNKKLYGTRKKLDEILKEGANAQTGGTVISGSGGGRVDATIDLAYLNSKMNLSENDLVVGLDDGKHAVIKADVNGNISQIRAYDKDGDTPKHSFKTIDELKDSIQGNAELEKLYEAIGGSESKEFKAHKVVKLGDRTVGVETTAKIDSNVTTLKFSSTETATQQIAPKGSTIANMLESGVVTDQDILVTLPDNQGYIKVDSDSKVTAFGTDGSKVEGYDGIDMETLRTYVAGESNDYAKQIYNILGGDKEGNFEAFKLKANSNGGVELQKGNAKIQQKVSLKFQLSSNNDNLRIEDADGIVSKIYGTSGIELGDVLVTFKNGSYGVIKTDGQIHSFNSDGELEKTYIDKEQIKTDMLNDTQNKNTAELYNAIGGDGDSFRGEKVHKSADGRMLMQSVKVKIAKADRINARFMPDTSQQIFIKCNAQVATHGSIIAQIYDKENICSTDVLAKVNDGYAIVKSNATIYLYDNEGNLVKKYADKAEVKQHASEDRGAKALYEALGGDASRKFTGYSMQKQEDGRILMQAGETSFKGKRTGISFSSAQYGKEILMIEGNTKEKHEALTNIYNKENISENDVLVSLPQGIYALMKSSGEIYVLDSKGQRTKAYSGIEQLEKEKKEDVDANEVFEALINGEGNLVAFKTFMDADGNSLLQGGNAQITKQKVSILSFMQIDTNDETDIDLMKYEINHLQSILDWFCAKYPEICENIISIRGIANSKAMHYFAMLNEDDKFLYIGSSESCKRFDNGTYIGEANINVNPKGVSVSNTFVWSKLEGEKADIIEKILSRVFSIRKPIFEQIKSHSEAAKNIADKNKADEIIGYAGDSCDNMLISEFVSNSARHIFVEKCPGKMEYIASVIPDEGTRYKYDGYKVYLIDRNHVLYTDGIIHQYNGFSLSNVQKKMNSAAYFSEIMEDIPNKNIVHKKLLNIAADMQDGEFVCVTNGPQNYVLKYCDEQKHEFITSYHVEVTLDELQPIYTLIPFKVLDGKIQTLNEYKNMSIEDEIMFIDSMEGHEYEIIKQIRLEAANCEDILAKLQNDLNKFDTDNQEQNSEDNSEQILVLTQNIEMISQRIEECSEKVQRYLSYEVSPMINNDYSIKVGIVDAQSKTDADMPSNIGIGDAAGIYEQTLQNIESVRRKMLAARRRLSENAAHSEQIALKKEFEDLKREYSRLVNTAKSLKSVINATKKNKKTNFEHL